MNPRFIPGNELTLLDSGDEYFPALIRAIDGALSMIRLETYIFADDATGRAVSDALRRAANRGVTVRLLVDGFGGREFQSSLMPSLVQGGVEALIFRPENSLFRVSRRRLRRLHRKMCAIDRRTAFIGGINILDDRNNPGDLPPRFDFATRIVGPLAQSVDDEMAKLWEIISWVSKGRRVRFAAHSPSTLEGTAPSGDSIAAIVVRDNVRHRRDIEHAYLHAIGRARHEVILANAYFLPGPRFRRALMKAASRGVRVTVIVQGRAEYPLQHYATQYLFDALLRAGVHIVVYDKSFLHAKVAVIDGHWATVGSSNIDPFSLLLAREANLVTRSATFAEALRKRLLLAANAESHRLDENTWRSSSLWIRSLRWGSYHVFRLLLAIAGHTPR